MKKIRNIIMNSQMTMGTECAIDLGKCPIIRWCNVNGYVHTSTTKKPDTDLRDFCGYGYEYQNIEFTVADLKRAEDLKEQIIGLCKDCKHK